MWAVFLLVICAVFAPKQMLNENLNFPDMPPNMLHTKVTFDPTKCDFEINRQNLHALLDEKFGNVTGIGVKKDYDNTYDITVSLHGHEGIDKHLQEHGFTGLKNHMKGAISPCENGGITIDEIQTLFSAVLPGRTENEDKHQIFDHLTNVLGVSRRFLQQKIEIPSKKSYKLDISEARNQGNIGACNSFSMDTIFQYYSGRDQNVKTKFSPKFYYYNRCLVEDSAACGSGMVIEYNGKLVKQVGNVHEDEYPYENVKEETYQDVIPDSVKKDATEQIPFYDDAQYICFLGEDFGSYYDFIVATKSYIAMYGPMILGTNVYDTDQCDIWNSHGTALGGGHAMSITGYDEEGIEIRNSWDTTWCNRGYTHMTWRDAYDKLDALCVWEKPTGDTEFCYDNGEVWKDVLDHTCTDYKENGWCANCGNGPNWDSSPYSGEAMDWVEGRCQKSCGCCKQGATYDDVTVTDENTGNGLTCFDVWFELGHYGQEIEWSVEGYPECAKTLDDNGPFQCCVTAPTTLQISCSDSYGDGWNGAVLKFDGQPICAGMENFEQAAPAYMTDTFDVQASSSDNPASSSLTDAPKITDAPEVTDAPVVESSSTSIPSNVPTFMPTRSPTRTQTNPITNRPTASPTRTPTEATIQVQCGNHWANSCADCPQGHGASWCNGECMWENNACVASIAESVSCGGHTASSCGDCPQGHGASWCNGECMWDSNSNTCVLESAGVSKTDEVKNGEEYCESTEMLTDGNACRNSNCCQWNTWEQGEASNWGQGRCWSNIGTDICNDMDSNDHTSVSCGAHTASSCADCPQGHGASWCNGECMWENNACVASSAESVSCGGHTASSCANCPQGNGASWCNGDCRWRSFFRQCVPKFTAVGTNLVDSSCTDEHDKCGEWISCCPGGMADTAECGLSDCSNPGVVPCEGNWMKTNCEQTCGVCTTVVETSSTVPTFMPTSSPTRHTTVSCGAHTASSCADCPQGHGASWCNGECMWENNACVDASAGSVSCGAHTASSCANCPQGNGAAWCNGDCMWENNACVSNGVTVTKIADGQKVECGHWLYQYPSTAAGCYDLVKALDECSNVKFSYANLNDNNCWCVTDDNCNLVSEEPVTTWEVTEGKLMAVGTNILDKATKMDHKYELNYYAAVGFFTLGLGVSYVIMTCKKSKNSDTYVKLLEDNVLEDI